MDNRMIDFVDTTRITTFFRDYAIAQIKVAYRIAEYLEPDSTFEPQNLNRDVVELINDERFGDAYFCILDELEIDIDSSHWTEALQVEAVELMKYLCSRNTERQAKEKLLRIEALKKELEELQK